MTEWYSPPYAKPWQFPRQPYGPKQTSGTPALGEIEILDEAEAAPNQTITIPSGASGTVTYELLDGGIPTPGTVPVDISAAANPAAVATLLGNAIAAHQPTLGLLVVGAEIDLTYDVPGPSPAIVYSGPADLLTVSGFAGGVAPEYPQAVPIRWGLSRGVLPAQGRGRAID